MVARWSGSALADIVPGLGLPECSQVVDVGCGAGDDVRWLHEAGFQTTGIDVSADALRIATTRTPPGAAITWVEGSATSLPLPDRSCALVTDRGCMHHLSPSDRSLYVREVERVLDDGGAWLIRDVVGHAGQVAEIGGEEIDALVDGTDLCVETCELVEDGGRHTWMVAVVRRCSPAGSSPEGYDGRPREERR